MIHLEIGVRVKWADGEGDWGRDKSMGVTAVTSRWPEQREEKVLSRAGSCWPGYLWALSMCTIQTPQGWPPSEGRGWNWRGTASTVQAV